MKRTVSPKKSFVLKSLLLCLPLIAACHSNPYDDQAMGRLSATPPIKNAVLPGFTVEAPAVVDVTEGASNVKIPVTSHVLSGTPVVTVEGLPPFATWDAKNSVVLLNPPIGASVDPAQPQETTRKYSIVVKATSSDAAMSYVQQTVIILVHHKAESLVVTGLNSQTDILEGTTFRTTLKITSLTYPGGPFYPVANSLPDGVSIAPTTDATVFTISYSPSFTTVTGANSTGTCFDSASKRHLCRTFNWTLNVTDPKGDAATVSTRWRVLDVRQDPTFRAPSSVDGTTSSVDFYIQAEDPNNERIPDVTVLQKPAVGTLTLTTVSTSNATASSYPSVLMHAVWTGNFQSLAGRSQVLNFKTCVKATSVSDTCVNSNVTANIRAAASDLILSGIAPTAQISEGQTYQATLTVRSASYPSGPFFVSGENVPDGLKITATANPTQFTVSYTPGYAAVTAGSPGSTMCASGFFGQDLCKITNYKLNVIDPKGALATVSSDLTVLDVRQAPLVILPKTVSGASGTAELYAQVEDPNGEVVPQISVNQPTVGVATAVTVASSRSSNGSLPYAMAQIVLKGANPSSTQALEVVACVNDANGQSTNCVTVPTTVNLN